MDDLVQLAELIKEKNEIEARITTIIDRPAIIGHVGEYIASKIFNIRLEVSASSKGKDGYFLDGELEGKSVNIKFYTKNERLLDITPSYLPDYYLVITGDPGGNISSKGIAKPWCITNVFLFESKDLIEKLTQRNLKIGVATSVAKMFWTDAELYPLQLSPILQLSEEQIQLLHLFRNV
mgnify:CR=1 FL=1